MGKMFTTKKRVRPVFVEDTDKTMFAEVCPAYGLPADFYEMGAMDELGFYYVLKSLKNGMAEFSDLKGYMFSVPFEDGVNMMIREALQEISNHRLLVADSSFNNTSRIKVADYISKVNVIVTFMLLLFYIFLCCTQYTEDIGIQASVFKHSVQSLFNTSRQINISVDIFNNRSDDIR